MSKIDTPTLVVPDVHLRVGRVSKILESWGNRGRVVFLGDFFDDFGDTPSKNTEMAMFLKEEILSRSDCVVLMGNHDLHYHPRCPRELRCSGFSEEKMKAINKVLDLEDFAKMRWALSSDGFLFTHAGLHPRLLPPFADVDASKIADWINKSCDNSLSTGDYTEPLLRAGYMRYGPQPVGGVIWMDFREYEHIPGLQQVFGHTPLRIHSVIKAGGEVSLCLDTNLECVGVVHEKLGEPTVLPVFDETALDFGMIDKAITLTRSESRVATIKKRASKDQSI